MPLTDTAIRQAKPEAKNRKLYDERGLFVIVTPKGGKWWRFKYMFEGKEKLLSLGTYPDTSLKDAREKRDEARKQVAAGIDPGKQRKAQRTAQIDKNSNSFEVIAREWFAQKSSAWTNGHSARILSRLEKDVFPWIGATPIAEIDAALLLAVIRRIEQRGANETAHRVLGNCGQIMRYAVATSRAQRDPCSDLLGALAPVKSNHFAAITDPKKVGGVLRAIDGYEGTPIVRCALRIAPLVFVRPGELRHAEWTDIDFESAEWRFIVTKTNTPHIVPLSLQAISIMQELYPLTGRGKYIFPSARNPKGDRPMSDNAILSALRRMGIEKDEMSGHGFRAMARTILDEVLKFRPEIIEQQLAHAVHDPNGRAYNRTTYLAERHKMMQSWADYLDSLKNNNALNSQGPHIND